MKHSNLAGHHANPLSTFATVKPREDAWTVKENPLRSTWVLVWSLYFYASIFLLLAVTLSLHR